MVRACLLISLPLFLCISNSLYQKMHEWNIHSKWFPVSKYLKYYLHLIVTERKIRVAFNLERLFSTSYCTNHLQTAIKHCIFQRIFQHRRKKGTIYYKWHWGQMISLHPNLLKDKDTYWVCMHFFKPSTTITCSWEFVDMHMRCFQSIGLVKWVVFSFLLIICGH